MRILWITNTVFPEPSKVLGLPEPVFGGWMYSLAEYLNRNNAISLAVATVYSGSRLKILDLNGTRYYLLPGDLSKGYQKHLEYIWKEIVEDYKPDVVHIHGTECQHGLACMRACEKENYVVSIQGLVGIISRYYYAGMSNMSIMMNVTIRDIIFGGTVYHGKNKLYKRGVYERECIRRAKHVIGRTTWDFVHAKNIKNNIFYHHCDEALREEFYSENKWDYKNIKKHTIFISQAGYPIKGMHQVLRAVSLIIKDYPDIQIRVAGPNMIDAGTFIKKIKITGYGKYIKNMIDALGLTNNVKFLGGLSGVDMVKEYLNAHLFISPSSIENSSNSIGEAQLLGVPVVASYVGGVPDMIMHKNSGLLYRYEEFEMLAFYIKQVFDDKEMACRLSVEGIKCAEIRHNKQACGDKIMEIYNKVCF